MNITLKKENSVKGKSDDNNKMQTQQIKYTISSLLQNEEARKIIMKLVKK